MWLNLIILSLIWDTHTHKNDFYFQHRGFGPATLPGCLPPGNDLGICSLFMVSLMSQSPSLCHESTGHNTQRPARAHWAGTCHWLPQPPAWVHSHVPSQIQGGLRSVVSCASRRIRVKLGLVCWCSSFLACLESPSPPSECWNVSPRLTSTVFRQCSLFYQCAVYFLEYCKCLIGSLLISKPLAEYSSFCSFDIPLFTQLYWDVVDM